MDLVYIEIFIKENNEIFTTIESFLVLFISNYIKDINLEIILVQQEDIPPSKQLLKLNKTNINYDIIKFNKNNHNISDLKLPVYVKENTIIAGLCAVCREIVMGTRKSKNSRINLLGFKEGCLLSPTECSVWTKFCEIDITQTVCDILNYDFNKSSWNYEFLIPDSLVRFESHMKQPIRVHNIYKIAQDVAKKENISSLEEERTDTKLSKATKQKNLIDSSIPVEQLNLQHKFAEGIQMTLADCLLYPCFKILFNKLPNFNDIKKLIPLTLLWFENLQEYDLELIETFKNLLDINPNQINSNISYIIEDFKNYSLYKSDPKRYKSKDRLFTRQEDILNSLEIFKKLNIIPTSQIQNDFIQKNIFNWNLIPSIGHPEFGELPENRIERKKLQLENLIKPIISIAKDNDRIIDFCSGSGHLGIILAQQLQNCHIIFLENKAISLNRAKERIKLLKLKNCSFYQSNIDYLIGNFNIGTSLHACGTATDIVLKKCINVNANFVCCPCCYGSIRPMPHIEYPLSRKFQNDIILKNYLYIAHAADQAHDLTTKNCNIEKSSQGKYCMDIIDTDRKLLAEENGYKVILTRLQPEDCTPKNRLLVGII